MMLSRPIASGAMLVLLIGAVGGAAWQGNGAPDAGVAEISEPEPVAEPEEREATAPNRVVESAGFPVVSQAERDKASEGPIVTINGRPLDSAPTTAEPEAEEEAVDEQAPVVTQEVEPEETQVAIAEPPLPRPRPEGLAVQSTETGLDYDAIADAAYEARQPQFLTPPEPRTLEPMPGVSDFNPNGVARSNQDELVGVVGPNGEVIWVYEDQVPTMNSRVTIQRQQPVNPFGFVFE